jgi:hypothetical protein
VQFCGLAGTSAGAIVASLKAAGFEASDLLDPESDASLIDRLREIDQGIVKATDIFGRSGWRRIVLFRWTLNHPLGLTAPPGPTRSSRRFRRPFIEWRFPLVGTGPRCDRQRGAPPSLRRRNRSAARQ